MKESLKKLTRLERYLIIFIALFGLCGSAYADITCNGRVIDAKDKQPVYCALVYVPEMKYKATTDKDGYFSITVPQGILLDIAYIGYKSSHMNARKEMGTIELEEWKNDAKQPPREKPTVEEIDTWVEEAYRLDEEDQCVSAAKLFKMAANEDYIPGSYGLGLCYLLGRGVDKDVTKGSQLVFFAAQDGYVDAEYTLGIMYRDGLGMPKNINEAKSWLGKAAAKGHKKAITELSKLN